MAEKYSYYTSFLLVEKKILKTHKIGRKNKYTAIVSEEDYQTAQAQTLIDKLYDGNAKGLISTLVQRDIFSAKDYEDLKQFWEKEGKNR